MGLIYQGVQHFSKKFFVNIIMQKNYPVTKGGFGDLLKWTKMFNFFVFLKKEKRERKKQRERETDRKYHVIAARKNWARLLGR